MDIGLQVAFSVLGGLGIFLLGMRNLSDGLQTIGGSRLRRLVAAVTDNRVMATLTGVVVTTMVQSSSITTCMVVGFVNSGFMTLSQAIGVIMGANIGTTITGWILALKLEGYGLPVLGVAALVYLFSRHERVRFWALVFMGLGMIFFGLTLMKDGFKPLRGSPAFMQWFHAFKADTYFGVLKCALVGCVLTCLVQSSSATLGITIGLASTGIIDFRTAAALVLGENIGTTITAFLASLGATTNAKRAAYAHVLFNLVGAAYVTALFGPYIWLIETAVVHDPSLLVVKDGVETFPRVTAGIASVHTVFNVVNVLVFLPFVRIMARALERLVPDRRRLEEPHLTALDSRLLESPVISIAQSRSEILRMATLSTEMVGLLREVIAAPTADPAAERRVLHREEVLDVLQKEITHYLTVVLSAGNVPHDVMDEGRRQLRMADEYESVGDYCSTVIKLNHRLRESGERFTPEGMQEIMQIHDLVAECVAMVDQSYRDEHPEMIAKIHTQGRLIKRHSHESRDKHLKRVSEGRVAPLASVLYNDMMIAYQKIGAHLMNIAEAIAREK